MTRLTTGLAALVLALGCSRSPTPAGVITVAVISSPNNFDPRIGTDETSQRAHQLIYDNLLSVFQAYTAQGKIPGWLGLWPVHLTMMAIVGFLFYRQLYGFRWQAALRR